MRKTNMEKPTKSKRETAEALLAKDGSAEIKQAEIVRGASRMRTPTSLRLSAPLLEAIDRLAALEHRKRGNMIQHILWEYVHRTASDVRTTLTKKQAS
jgi:hypothetical protein